MEQGFTFGFAWAGASSGEARIPGIWIDPDPESPQNNWVSTRQSDKEDVYLVEFINPERLHWTSDTTFQAYFYTGEAVPDTLLFRVGTERVNCCPQWTIRELYRNGVKVRAPCDAKEPVRLEN